MTEAEARQQYGDQVKVYQSRFTNMFFAMSPPERKQRTIFKLVCVGAEERVVGIHLLGMASDEMMQGFAVAVKMGATKSDLGMKLFVMTLISI